MELPQGGFARLRRQDHLLALALPRPLERTLPLPRRAPPSCRGGPPQRALNLQQQDRIPLPLRQPRPPEFHQSLL